MKKLLFACLVIISVSRNFSQENVNTITLQGKVEYISSQYYYVQFENTRGLGAGDTLFVNQNEKYIPQLIIESLSSRSCATRSINGKVDIGTEVFGTTDSKQFPNEMSPEKVHTVEENQKQLIQVDTAEFIGLYKIDRGIYGRFSISTYSNISNIPDRVDYQNWRYSLSLNADQFEDSRFSFSNYVTFRYRADEWSIVKSNVSDALKVYDLSLKYDFNPSSNILIGRKINRNITNIGAIDGVQYETKQNHYTLGVVFGSRPDYSNYGYNLDLLQFGGYVSRTDSIAQGAMHNTIGVMQQMNDLATDRRFLYLQHNNNLLNKVNLFLSTEIDLFEKINEESSNNLRLTSLYLSLRFSPIKWLSTSLSYDARKNVIYYETFKNYADQLLESALRQGIRFRINVRPLKYVMANLYTGYRFRESDIRPTRNYGGSITHSRIPFLKLSANVSFINLSTNYLNGNVWGTRISKDLFSGFLYGALGYKKVDYTFTNSESKLLQDIVQLDISLRITKKISFSLYFEGTYEENTSYSNIYINLITRF